MNSSKDYNEAMARIANKLVLAIRDEMWNKGLVDTQNLLNSVESKIEGNDILIYTASYLPYSEFGRGSGGVPSNFAQIIAMWAARKNIHLNKGTYQDFGESVKWKTIKYGSARFRGVIPDADVLTQPVEDVMNSTKSEEFEAVLTSMIWDGLDDLLDL